jgi:prevent-host-death family protein
MTYYMAMEYGLDPHQDPINVAEFKAHISEYLEAIEKGREVTLCRRNVPIARIAPISTHVKNKTRLGWSEGKGKILGDLTEPLIPLEDWEMLRT